MSKKPRHAEHCPGIEPPTADRWIDSACLGDGSLFAAFRLDRGAHSVIRLCRGDADGPMQTVVDVGGDEHPFRPSLAAVDDRVVLAWTATGEDGWRVALAEVVDGVVRETTVWRSTAACLAPQVFCFDGRPWLTFPALDGSSSRVMLARPTGPGQWDVVPVSDADTWARRPTTTVANGAAVLAWDRRCNGRYEMACRRVLPDGTMGPTQGLGRDEVNRLLPTACSRGDVVELAWLEVSELVHRDLGAFDHDVRVGLARMEPGAQLQELGIAADLRPGLLPGTDQPYRGYDGLRRRPQLVTVGDGSAWLVWESRDAGGGKRAGRLLGRPVDGTGDPVLLHEGGLCYAVSSAPGGPMQAAFFPVERQDEPAVHRVQVDLDALPEEDPSSRRRRVDVSTWSAWQPTGPIEPTESRPSIDTPDGPMNLYWVDLHCHSIFSPDAEGHVDELLHYARHVAALDGVAVVDNDYYPNKTLSESEWRIEQELARAHTDPGHFVVFPAYEFTYHDATMEPDFNHRYVLYPDTGPLLRRVDPESNTYETLCECLRGRDVLLVAHHGTWRLGAPVPEHVEVCSSWRVCIEEMDVVGKRLAAGDRFSFLGTSDSHRACPGLGGALTGVYAPELTRQSLFEALRRGRTIATQGRRVFMDLRIGEAVVGQCTTVDGSPRIELHYRAPAEVESIGVLRNGTVVHHVEAPAQEGEVVFVDDHPNGPTCCYHARLKMVGDPSFNAAHHGPDCLRPFVQDGPYPSNLANAHGPFAWTSPVWVRGV